MTLDTTNIGAWADLPFFRDDLPAIEASLARDDRQILPAPDRVFAALELTQAQVQIEDVSRATLAVIATCNIKGYDTVAMPLTGAFETGIPAEEAARAIHSEFKSSRKERPLRVLLLARTAEEVDVYEMAIEGLS